MFFRKSSWVSSETNSSGIDQGASFEGIYSGFLQKFPLGSVQKFFSLDSSRNAFLDSYRELFLIFFLNSFQDSYRIYPGVYFEIPLEVPSQVPLRVSFAITPVSIEKSSEVLVYNSWKDFLEKCYPRRNIWKKPRKKKLLKKFLRQMLKEFLKLMFYKDERTP